MRRLPTRVLLPAVALSCAFLIGCDDQFTDDYYPSSTTAYAAAHPKTTENRSGAVAPPAATDAYPQGATGPGTPSYVPPTTQSDVIAFVQSELDRVNQLIQKGNLDRASEALDGLDLRRSTWSRATQSVLDPQLASTRKSLDAARQAKS